jgi:hypothetical protein
MAIYRKNAGAVSRWRKASGKKMYTSLKTVTDDRGVKHGIEEKNGKFYRLRDGKRVPKAAKSKSTDPHKHFLTRENAALFLARMADPSLGKSEDRAGSSFVKKRQSNIKKGLMGGHVSGGKLKGGRKSKGRGKKQKKVASDVMEMSWTELRQAAGSDYKVGMTKEQVIDIVTRSNPGRRGRGRGSVSFYDLY